MPPSTPTAVSTPSSLFLFLSFLLLLPCAQPTPTYVYQICGSDAKNATEFSPNSTYESNLNSLLSSLSSSNSTRNRPFRNLTVGGRPNGSASATVYGLSLCRGDVTTDVCQECVAAAGPYIRRTCARVRSAVIWYDECLVRYSDRYIFSTSEQEPSVEMLNTGNITEPNRFAQLLADTMSKIVTRAATDRTPPEKFATAEAAFSGFQKLHTLAQCTPDLSSSDCSRCLEVAASRLPGCCGGKQGGRVLMPSCYVRFEVYPFYNESVGAAPAPSPAPIITSLPPPVAVTSPGGVCALIFPLLYYIWCKKPKKKSKVVRQESGSEIATIESLQFDFVTIKAATNNFSNDNKIGEGGFGVVYKGTLPNGQEIAIKRLSKASGQGAEEFKNEVVLLAKLQHRNLVRLLGFCLEGEEKILVYEFVPNKSLDIFLFDPKKQGILDWSKRYKIIGEIARGLLYLHADSRLRIIHRDLKASNILLDGGMNAKISDFGMARIFGADQTQGSTTNVVGTYGYMPPEYAMHGHFSVKSDVYSFGVLILEIVSGKKISYFDQGGCIEDLISYVRFLRHHLSFIFSKRKTILELNLVDSTKVINIVYFFFQNKAMLKLIFDKFLLQAWKLWRDGVPLELMDPTLRGTYSRNEVLRCIHIGLLCVQEDVAARPMMESVVLVLGSLTITLPLPQQPAFVPHSMTQPGSLAITDAESDESKSKTMPCSVNEASITEPYPR
ncbi:cysteine-rich receptor-like protein kinase 25 isoform X2 [Malania oleifera]|uniref:cysteine-rich receptor-like protein kinase 25 isoform X2 n=1 Tax=Malania oleifera TaxID=397392 RepID=UPI0025AE8279|nr:cysteine-rich receptor-like protein kinase 25 isoform X2 [Malania oleifera]